MAQNWQKWLRLELKLGLKLAEFQPEDRPQLVSRRQIGSQGATLRVNGGFAASRQAKLAHFQPFHWLFWAQILA